MKILVTAASKHGSTREIGEAISRGLLTRGVDSTYADVESVSSFDGYDAVVLGSAVYAGHWLKSARDFADSHAATLAGLPVWIFSSGPVGAPDPKPEEDPADAAPVMEATRAIAHRVFPGKIDKAVLTWPEKAIVRALKVADGDFRDWEAIDAWAAEIAARLEALDSARAG